MKLSFENIFIDATKTVEKIPQTEYLPSGQYPIIDQGQRHIAGYSNHSTGFCADVPAIIFGDHTRVIKYIDKPFFIGADGVKVLKSKSNATDYKYLFYALSSIKIPNTGYNRHFKWLKGSKIPVYNSTLQKRIAKRLDKVQELIAKQKEQIAKLDLLIKSRFLDMFGDPISNPKKWRKEKIFDVIETNISKVKSKYTEDDTIKYVDISSIDNITNTVRRFTTYLVKNAPSRAQQCLLKDDILISTVRPNLRNIAINNRTDCNMVASSGFCVLRSNVCNPMWLFEIIKSNEFTSYLSNLTTGANYPAVKDHDVYNYLFPCPPVILQTQFANFVKSVEQQKEVFSTRLSHFETLYKSLMQEYFG